MNTNVISFPGLGIDPFEVNEVAFEIFGFSVHWYGLIIMCGMLFCVLYVYHHWKKEGWNPDHFFDVAIAAIAVFALAGIAVLIYAWRTWQSTKKKDDEIDLD